mmetsp:Transcript_117078/g.278111  ORF Transcript_117078/g.278111 Transcript_117078/m.278111 type:complete len:258 (-) Transcript_117078:153-926(-)
MEREGTVTRFPWRVLGQIVRMVAHLKVAKLTAEGFHQSRGLLRCLRLPSFHGQQHSHLLREGTSAQGLQRLADDLHRFLVLRQHNPVDDFGLLRTALRLLLAPLWWNRKGKLQPAEANRARDRQVQHDAKPADRRQDENVHGNLLHMVNEQYDHDDRNSKDQAGGQGVADQHPATVDDLRHTPQVPAGGHKSRQPEPVGWGSLLVLLSQAAPHAEGDKEEKSEETVGTAEDGQQKKRLHLSPAWLHQHDVLRHGVRE